MRFTIAFALSVAAGLLVSEARAQSSGFLVIVHPDNPVDAVERKFLADAFLKKLVRWPHQQIIQPVDLDPDTPIRRRFSAEVLSRSVAAVKSYWQQLIFSGRDVPPPELSSEDDVVEYVRRHPGAIGYVSANADVSGVKVVKVR